jgi:hypothetical protein
VVQERCGRLILLMVGLPLAVLYGFHRVRGALSGLVRPATERHRKRGKAAGRRDRDGFGGRDNRQHI